MNEPIGELITFETAKLAKEKGFDQYLYPCYANDKQIHTVQFFLTQNEDSYFQSTQTYLKKWLREKHNIIVTVKWYGGAKFPNMCFNCIINNFYEKPILTHIYDTYEQALEIGLQKALKLIKI